MPKVERLVAVVEGKFADKLFTCFISEKISDLTAQTELQDFWSNQKNAEKVIKDRNFLLEIKNNYDFIFKEHLDNKDLLDIAFKENDEVLAKDLNKSFESNLEKLKKIELLCFLSNENDALDAYVEIHAGAGGTESQDWAEMLRRMYSRWAEKNNFRVELIHESRGEEAGIKSSTIKIINWARGCPSNRFAGINGLSTS